jgi:hypothetical protein
MAVMPGSSFVYAVYLMAFARLIVLLTVDVITARPRDAVVEAVKEHGARAALNVAIFAAANYLHLRFPCFAVPDTRRGRPLLAYMLLCPWCLSVWLAIPAAPIIYAYGDSPWLFVPALGLALSAAAGALARVKG